jgi:hypothetical protein
MNKSRKKIVTVVMVLILSSLACTVYSIAWREDMCEAIGGRWIPDIQYGGVGEGECFKPVSGNTASEDANSELVDEIVSEPVDENVGEPADEIVTEPDSPPVVDNEEPTIEENEDDIVVETDPLSMTWEGEAHLSNTSNIACAVCLPPTLTGNLVLTVDMKSYTFEGRITLEGEGQAIGNICDGAGNPTGNTCTGQGTGSVTGSFSGVTDSTGAFSVEFLSAGVLHWGWVEGCGAPTSFTDTFEDPTWISGTFNWQGTSEGTINLGEGSCSVTGEWSADLVAIEYPQEPSP